MGSNRQIYSQKQGLDVRTVQTIFEDKEGRFWVGGGGGLYRYDGNSFKKKYEKYRLEDLLREVN